MLVKSSKDATLFRMLCAGNDTDPRNSSAFAAASNGHGPFSFCSSMRHSRFCENDVSK